MATASVGLCGLPTSLSDDKSSLRILLPSFLCILMYIGFLPFKALIASCVRLMKMFDFLVTVMP